MAIANFDKPALKVETWVRGITLTGVDESRAEAAIKLADGRIGKGSAVITGEVLSTGEYQRATANAIRAALDDLKL